MITLSVIFLFPSMPKPVLVSSESVREAAARLTAAGQQPSVRKVQNLLGGGSPNTINELLRGLRREGLAMPAPIDEAIVRAINAQILRARDEASAQFQARLDATEAEVSELLQAGDDATRQIAELSAALSDAQAQAHRVAGQLDEARSNAERLQAQLDRQEAAAKAELADLRERMASAQKAQAVAENSAQHLRESFVALERRLADLEKRSPPTKPHRTRSETPSIPVPRGRKPRSSGS